MNNMKHIFIIGLLFLSINSQSQTIFGDYNNKGEDAYAYPFQLVINQDSTFSYYYLTGGALYLEGGFIERNNNTLILISNEMCPGCLDVVYSEHTDYNQIFFSFDPELKKKFPDLKVTFASEFEKQYDIDDENNLIIQDVNLPSVPMRGIVMHLRSRNFNSFIILREAPKGKVRGNVSITLKPDYEKRVKERRIYWKYLITESGDLKCIESRWRLRKKIE